LELLHFELCLGHNSETTGILFFVQNLVGGHHPVQPALVMYCDCSSVYDLSCS
jgi:hypothetical protein